MVKWIEREAALACFHDWLDKRGDVHTPDEMAEYRAIEALPSWENLQPVRHGRWILKEERVSMMGTIVVCKCSDCGKNQTFKSTYCPNCGAKMDGGEE